MRSFRNPARIHSNRQACDPRIHSITTSSPARTRGNLDRVRNSPRECTDHSSTKVPRAPANTSPHGSQASRARSPTWPTASGTGFTR